MTVKKQINNCIRVNVLRIIEVLYACSAYVIGKVGHIIPILCVCMPPVTGE
jgi:hypothetical protein